MSTNLYRAYLFFKEHGAYCSTASGPAACALALARAEEEAEELGMVFIWEEDEPAEAIGADGAYYWHDAERCLAYLPDEDDPSRPAPDTPTAALGGIIRADGAYRRVVKAGLAACVLETRRAWQAPLQACERCSGPLSLHDTGEALQPMCGPCQVGPPLEYR